VERNAAVPKDEQCILASASILAMWAEDNNLYGTGVNVAVRLQQLAQPGGVCVSQTVYDQVGKIVQIHLPGYRRAVLEEHRRSSARLPHPSRAVDIAQSGFSPDIWRSPWLGAAAGVAVLLLALGAQFYLRQPAVFWDAVLGESTLPEHPTIAVMPSTT
jgi:hypothetical protein